MPVTARQLLGKLKPVRSTRFSLVFAELVLDPSAAMAPVWNIRNFDNRDICVMERIYLQQGGILDLSDRLTLG